MLKQRNNLVHRLVQYEKGKITVTNVVIAKSAETPENHTFTVTDFENMDSDCTAITLRLAALSLVKGMQKMPPSYGPGHTSHGDINRLSQPRRRNNVLQLLDNRSPGLAHLASDFDFGRANPIMIERNDPKFFPGMPVSIQRGDEVLIGSIVRFDGSLVLVKRKYGDPTPFFAHYDDLMPLTARV